MIKRLCLLLALLVSAPAFADNAFLPAYQVPNGPFTSSVPVSSSTPLPVAVYSNSTSGYVLTSNGSGPATFQSGANPSTPVNLGTSTAAASPRITGDATSGFMSDAAGTVETVISGTKLVTWTANTETVNGTIFGGAVCSSDLCMSNAFGHGYIYGNGFRLGEINGGAYNNITTSMFYSSNGYSVAPVNTADIYGAVAIGTSYAGIYTAPTNGEIIQGNVGIGTSSVSYPLTVIGTSSATNYYANSVGSNYVPVYSFNGSTGTGMYLVGGNNLSFTNNGNQIMDFSFNQIEVESSSMYGFANGAPTLLFQSSNSTTPIFSFRNNLTMGMGGDATNDILYLDTNSLPRVTIGSSGLVGIGTTSPLTTLDVRGTTSFPQFVGNSAAPTIAAGTGAGTSPTVSITGNNLAGIINVTTGTSPTASGTIATVTFNGTLTQAPKTCQVTAANAATGLAAAAYYVAQSAISTTTWSLSDTTTALAALTAYSWGYLCGG